MSGDGQVIRNEVTERGGEPYREIDIDNGEGISELGWRIDDKSEGVIAACRSIVDGRSAAEYAGVLVDLQTANAIVTVYDALSPSHRISLMERWGDDVYALGTACWKLIARSAQ